MQCKPIPLSLSFSRHKARWHAVSGRKVYGFFLFYVLFVIKFVRTYFTFTVFKLLTLFSIFRVGDDDLGVERQWMTELICSRDWLIIILIFTIWFIKKKLGFVFVVFLTDVLDFLIDYWFNRLQTDLGSRSLYDRLVLRLYEGAIDFITWLIVDWFHRLNDIDRLSLFDEGLGVWRVLDVGLLIDYWLMGCLWEFLIWSNDGLIMEGSQIQLL